MKRIWIISLTTAILIGCSTGVVKWQHDQINQLEAELEVAHEEIEARGTIIKHEVQARQSSQETLSEVLDRLTLITTFQDADFTITPSSVRDLLDLADTLPYGRPLSGGYRVTSQFGQRSIARYGWVDQEHLGIDLIPTNGDWTVISPVDGYISDWGWSDLYGNYIEMTTQTGYRLFFAHLAKVYFPHHEDGVWFIDPEQPVAKGVRIGEVGSTGQYSTGPHLHYEVWISKGENTWVPLNPEEILRYVPEAQ